MYRQTKQKEAILKYLRDTTSHPTADMIYEDVRKKIPSISKGTVYRNLKVLEKSGKVSKLNIKGTITRYEGRTGSHYHFRCERCGRVFDIDEPIDTGLDKRIAARTGFKITHHQLEFRGLCTDCISRGEKWD
ncbi:MAG: transcriptional repressor [Chloroflexi bacterium RBG_16_50_11]|nr:MAG: transcriptional repressor [Chloroflexi bacterium RBG_16_50_11]